jgi:type II secretory pathway predicted ATPase ExeA
LNNPALTRTEFIQTLSQRFGLTARAGESKAALLEELEAVLLARRARGEVTALAIDEAQSLSNELLEELRLLANSETTQVKLLPLILAGQPELRDRLNQENLRQLKQRVTLRCELQPLTLEATAAYIATRIKVAGGEAAKLFSREAVIMIYERSGGIPRTISVMCDNALMTGFALGKRPVDREIVLEVARDFDLSSSAVADTRAPEPMIALPPGEGSIVSAPPSEEDASDMTLEREMFEAPRRRFRFLRGR